jgi:hypothetical protein
VQYEDISTTWREVERYDWVECGTFSPDLSLVMALQDIPGQTAKVAIRDANHRPAVKTR